jgi:hypothetical protein
MATQDTTAPEIMPTPGDIVPAAQGNDVVGSYSSPYGDQPMRMSSDESRTQFAQNGQAINEKIAGLTHADGSAMATQPADTIDPATGKRVVVSPDAGSTTAPAAPAPTYVDQHFADTHDMTSANSPYKGYVVTSNGQAPDGSTSTATSALQKQTDEQNSQNDALSKMVTNSFNSWKTGAGSDAALNDFIDSIHQTFQASIAQMQETNRQQTAMETTAGFRGGGGGAAHYASQINNSVIADTVQKGVMRINTLQAQEKAAIVMAKQAHDEKDFVMTNQYVDKMKELTKEKTAAIVALHTAVTSDQNELLKQNADARAATKQTIADSISTAKTYAEGMWNATQGMDEMQKKKYYYDFAVSVNKQHGVQVTPEQLRSVAETQGIVQTKATSTVANQANEIKNRDAGTVIKQENAVTAQERADTAAKKGLTPKVGKGGTDGAYTYKASDIAEITNGLNLGLSLHDGTKTAPRGTDGYVDPASYTQAYTLWIGAGGTPKGFATKFPATNVNPASYKELPKAIQPKTKKGGGA